MNDKRAIHESRVSFSENVRQFAFQAFRDLVKNPQRGALLALLKPVQCRGRQTDLPGEFGEGHLTASFSKERGELLFQDIAHTGDAWENAFRLRNILWTRR